MEAALPGEDMWPMTCPVFALYIVCVSRVQVLYWYIDQHGNHSGTIVQQCIEEKSRKLNLIRI